MSLEFRDLVGIAHPTFSYAHLLKTIKSQGNDNIYLSENYFLKVVINSLQKIVKQ
jgi:hypothetical protein